MSQAMPASEASAAASEEPAGRIVVRRPSLLRRLAARRAAALALIPLTALVLAVWTAVGRGVTNAIVAIGMLGIPLTARVARAAILVERGKEYVLAARTSGNSDFRLIRRELLPNIVPPLILMTSLLAANAIL